MNGVLESVRSGDRGQVLCYVRPNRRSPAREFRDGMTEEIRAKFNHMFRRICTDGLTKSATHHQSLAPLTRDGKGLWSIKENDHRFYAFQAPSTDGADRLVLLDGWVKDNSFSKIEPRAIAHSLELKEECMRTVDWTTQPVPYGSTIIEKSPEPEPQIAPRRIVGPEDVRIPESPSQESSVVEGSRDRVTPTTLVALAKVKKERVQYLAFRGKLPGGTHDNRRWTWPWSMVDELVAIVKSDMDGRRSMGEHLRTGDGKYTCPKCGRKFEKGSEAFGHTGHCHGPDAQTPMGPAKVLTKKELSRMADRLIEGKVSTEEFTAAVSANRSRVVELEAQLRKLKGRK